MPIRPTVDNFSAFVVEGEQGPILEVHYDHQGRDVTLIFDKHEANMLGLWLIGVAHTMGDLDENK